MKLRQGLAFCLWLLAVGAWAQTDVWRADSLQEVVVTGTGTQHLLKDAPVQTEVISQRQLQQYAGKSIEDILSGLTASFDFSESDMSSRLQMNGLGNSYVLILINGRRLHGDNGGENDLSLIDPNNIEKIEIVKGASSALYGSDAIAGVINIITKKHKEQGLMLENTTRFGSYGDIRQHNGLALNYGKFSSYTNFQLQHSDGWQNTSEEAISQTEYHITDSRNKTVNRHTNWQVSEHLTYQFSPNIEVYADGSIYWKRIYRPCGHHPGVDVKTYDLQYDNASISAGGKWYLGGSKKEDRGTRDVITLDVDWKKHAYNYVYTDTTLTDGYVNGRFTNYFPYFPGDKELQSDHRLTNVSLKGVFTLPYEQRLSAGFDYRYDWLKAPMRVTSGKATDNTEALYVQDELALLNPLHITAGLRLTRNEGFGFRLTPKVSAMLKLGDLRLRATWSQGYKTPTTKELHYQYIKNMNGVYLYLGNTDLKAQHSNYFGMSAEYTIGNLTMTVASYYNKVNDMITLVTIPTKDAPGELITQYDPIRVRQYQNMEDAKTYGVDVTVRYQTKEWTAGGSYSYLDTKAHQYDSEDETMKEVIIDGMAHHKANVYVTWNHDFSRYYHLGIGIYGRMSSKRYYQIDGDGKGYQLWRLSTSHQFGKNYRLEAGIDNIFNYVDRTPHGLHLGTTTPGTTVYASLVIRFNKGKKLTNKYKSNLNSRDNEEN
ncbi:outer membrane receptor for ferrienterochelin and colicins [Prevotella sp. tf2-5]|nr:outer membrane receptor for ferrienterochelin and colicins [Prevotella sp. tf2-5]